MALSITINKVAVAASFTSGTKVADIAVSGGTSPYAYELATGGDYFQISGTEVQVKADMNIENIQPFSVTATDSTSGTALTVTSDVVYPAITAKIQSRFNSAGKIYKITQDIDLGHGVLTVPYGCTLDFQGGSFNNGNIILNNTSITANPTSHIFNNIKLSGTFRGNSFHVGWVGALISNSDNADALKEAIILSGTLLVPIEFCRGIYNISKPIVFNSLLNNVFIKGNRATISKNNEITTGITEEVESYGGNVSINVASILVITEGHYWTIRDLSFTGGDNITNKNRGINIVKGSHWIINNCNINYCTIGINAYNLWMSNITRVTCTDNNIGFYWNSYRLNENHGNTGTSICFSNCYAQRCDTGFQLEWLNYSTLNCCASDQTASISYRFLRGTTLVMNGCGTEVTKVWLSADNSRIVLNTCQFMSNSVTTDSNIACFNQSEMLFNNCYFNNGNDSRVKIANTNSIISINNSNLTITEENLFFNESTTGIYTIQLNGIMTVITYNGGRNENIFDLKSRTSGTTEQRPTAINAGFEYYDSTLKKKILWNGTAWVNMDGTALEESTALNNIEEIPASEDKTN